MSLRYPAAALVTFARELLAKTGLEPAKASVVAEILVEGDLLGHTTHGLALLAPYLAALDNGTMTKAGEPQVLADFPGAVTWDGRRLPGPWLVVHALEVACARARQVGTCTVAIRRSHHIACLAAYGRRATEQGLMMILTCSDPSVRGVAPYGGTRDVMTPNPLAAAWPTRGDPVLLDISSSITTHGMTKRLHTEGRKLPGPWVQDADGRATDDPSVMFATPPGTLLPTGGVDHGHKGYALGLLVEALTAGLSGHGRADAPEGWSATVLLQVFDPRLFGGRDDFLRQTTQMVDACHASAPRPGVERVRLPGEAGLRRREAQLLEGVALYPSILPMLTPWAEKFGVALPASSGGS